MAKRICLTVLVLLAVGTADSEAQYRRNRYAPYRGGGGWGGYPYGYANQYAGPGGYLHGASDVLSATGDLYVKQEQARVEREKANQAKLETRKQEFDLKNYEKANTPTFTDMQEVRKSERVARVMNDATIFEIKSGSALNTLMPFVYQLTLRGIQGPQVPIDPYTLQQVNVTGGSEDVSPGLLKDGGKLQWPLELRGPEQKRIDALFPQAISEAAQKMLDPKVFRDLKTEADKLNDIVIKKLGKNELDGASYLESKRFIKALQDALSVLRRTDAYRYINGDNTATGRNVQELVSNMEQRGLRFAPASPGGEAAYRAVYSAMVAYANGAASNSGFRVRMNRRAAPNPDRPK